MLLAQMKKLFLKRTAHLFNTSKQSLTEKKKCGYQEAVHMHTKEEPALGVWVIVTGEEHCRPQYQSDEQKCGVSILILTLRDQESTATRLAGIGS